MVILKCENSCRLDKLLQEKLPTYFDLENIKNEISNSKIRRLIISGSVFVNNIQCRTPSFNISKKDIVSIDLDIKKFFFEKQNNDVNFVMSSEYVLYEDEYFIIVNKVANYPCESTIVSSRKNMHDDIVKWLWQKNTSLRNKPYVGIMHRLDRTTSGVLLFTKQRQVNAFISDLFANRKIKKLYRAVVTCNNISNIKNEFSVENYIGKINNCGKWGIVKAENGRLSKTDFYVKGEGFFNGEKVLYVNAMPQTGRTHQIRIHLSSSNLPIVGDTLYGGKTADRIYLHAHSLEFYHPITSEKIKVVAPLPAYFGTM